MRVSVGSVLSVSELTRINKLSMLMLWVVHNVRYDSGYEEGSVSCVYFTFTRSGHHDKRFRMIASAYVDGVKKDVTPGAVPFDPPEGCNLDEVFDLLDSQVGMLAFSLTHGEFESVATGVEKTVDDISQITTYVIEVNEER